MTNCDKEIIEIERLTMELEQAKSALLSKWQPISTAPKDGTLILVFEPLKDYQKKEADPSFGKGTKIARWQAVDYERRADDRGWVPSSWGWVEPYEGYHQFEPTHWQPEPEPPEEVTP